MNLGNMLSAATRWLFPKVCRLEKELDYVEANIKAAEIMNEKQRQRSKEATQAVISQSERIKTLTAEVLDDIHNYWRKDDADD